MVFRFELKKNENGEITRVTSLDVRTISHKDLNLKDGEYKICLKPSGQIIVGNHAYLTVTDGTYSWFGADSIWTEYDKDAVLSLMVFSESNGYEVGTSITTIPHPTNVTYYKSNVSGLYKMRAVRRSNDCIIL